MTNQITLVLQQNWPSVLILLIAIIFIMIVLVNKNYQLLRAEAFRLMMQVEKKNTVSTAGYKKFEKVYNTLYDVYIPSWFRVFYSKEDMREILQYWYEELKDYLDNGILDNSTQAKKQSNYPH